MNKSLTDIVIFSGIESRQNTCTRKNSRLLKFGTNSHYDDLCIQLAGYTSSGKIELHGFQKVGSGAKPMELFPIITSYILEYFS